MNHLLARQLEEALGVHAPAGRLAFEPSLRAAASTLSNATSDEMTATTVVGVLGQDDLDALRKLVATITEDYELEAAVKVRVGSFSVRFSRP